MHEGLLSYWFQEIQEDEWHIILQTMRDLALLGMHSNPAETGQPRSVYQMRWTISTERIEEAVHEYRGLCQFSKVKGIVCKMEFHHRSRG